MSDLNLYSGPSPIAQCEILLYLAMQTTFHEIRLKEQNLRLTEGAKAELQYRAGTLYSCLTKISVRQITRLSPSLVDFAQAGISATFWGPNLVVFPQLQSFHVYPSERRD